MPKHHSVPKAPAGFKPSPANEETAVARLTHDLREALEQQSATSEVLRVISSYPGDPQPVFRAMLKNAVRLCDAKFGNIYSWDGDALHLVATENAPTAFAEARRRSSSRPSPKTPTGRMIANRKVVHIADLRAEKAYADRDPWIVAGVELGGVRTVLMVPMLKENELIGAFSVYRQETRPFTDTQIALGQNFAAQAVIAIENARLLNELRQSLAQQTATADVLKVISRSTFDLQTVLNTLVLSATSLCVADMSAIYQRDGEFLRLWATTGVTPEAAQYGAEHPLQVGRNSASGRAALEGEAVHILDVLADAEYSATSLRDAAGYRTVLGVPLLRAGTVIGVFALTRREVSPFSEKQIELVTTFAAQAVIAIENARLLNELRQSLEEQTATSDVLRVISSSPGELEPVFATMLEQAVRICEASVGSMVLRDGDMFRRVAIHGAPLEFVNFHESRPTLRLSDAFALNQILRTKQVVQIGDVQAEEPETPIAKYGGARTLLTVPLLKENEVIGALGIYRHEVRLFSDKQIALVENFAAQAVIAIENARLLNELRQRTTDLTERTTDLTEALEQQTATSEVLQVISGSPSDPQPVFEAMLEKAVRVCDATFGGIYRYEGEANHLLATHNTPAAFVEALKQSHPYRPTSSLSARLLATKSAVQVVDLAADHDYVARRSPSIVAAVELGGTRTVLAVPMLKENELVGMLMLNRQEVRPFTDKQIALVTNFATQAVIAIENARLLNELRERTHEVVKLNQHLEHRVADQVGEIERMGRLRRFLPPQVADLIVASGSEKQLESHRREITALFCDLRGFTGFTESADAEDVMALLRDYHAAIGEIIIKYSGTLERYAGDGVMVVFNDPVPVDNPALQAVLMALELRNALGALTQIWSRLGHEIGFGIGIAHGFATLGTIGYEGRFDYAAIGTVSNVASRLCDEAKPGQILISARVLMKVEDAVKVEPVGEFELKGIRRPLAAYNVIAAAS